MERSRAIAATPERIFPFIDDLEKQQQWSPWAERDPEMAIVYGEKRAGVGAVVSWESARDDVGVGSQRIVQSVPDKSIVTDLDFGANGRATAYFDIMEEGERSVVTWGFETDLGANPLMRWLGLGMDDLIGGDYERGLERLAALVEG